MSIGREEAERTPVACDCALRSLENQLKTWLNSMGTRMHTRKEIHVVMNQVQSYMKTLTCYNTQWDRFLHLEYINKRYERVLKCHFFVH